MVDNHIYEEQNNREHRIIKMSTQKSLSEELVIRENINYVLNH